MLDAPDQKLLTLLQSAAMLTNAELGERLAMSPSQVGRRKQRLEAEGYIMRYAAIVDPQKIGMAIQAFVQVSMNLHSSDSSSRFHALMRRQPEVTSVWALTGDTDYMLRVYCPSLKMLNDFLNGVLLPHDSVARVHSQIVMDQIKEDAPLSVNLTFD